jgi:hypothetical protein
MSPNSCDGDKKGPAHMYGAIRTAQPYFLTTSSITSTNANAKCYRPPAVRTNGWPISVDGSAFGFGRNFATLFPCAFAT